FRAARHIKSQLEIEKAGVTRIRSDDSRLQTKLRRVEPTAGAIEQNRRSPCGGKAVQTSRHTLRPQRTTPRLRLIPGGRANRIRAEVVGDSRRLTDELRQAVRAGRDRCAVHVVENGIHVTL